MNSVLSVFQYITDVGKLPTDFVPFPVTVRLSKDSPEMNSDVTPVQLAAVADGVGVTVAVAVGVAVGVAEALGVAVAVGVTAAVSKKMSNMSTVSLFE